MQQQQSMIVVRKPVPVSPHSPRSLVSAVKGDLDAQVPSAVLDADAALSETAGLSPTEHVLSRTDID